MSNLPNIFEPLYLLYSHLVRVPETARGNARYKVEVVLRKQDEVKRRHHTSNKSHLYKQGKALKAANSPENNFFLAD
jgi:hypothetical protein